MADLKVDVERANTNTTTTPTPTPSIPQLFAHLTRRDVLVLFTPACIVSILAGGISPFMTRIIGQAFNAFASYPLTRPPPPGATHTLLHDVGIASVELVALAGGILALSSLVSALWMWVGERNVMRLRKAVYDAVASKDMAWFDIHLSQSSDEEKENAEEEEGGGSGGLLSKFISSTEDVRTATSLAFGTLIQDIITFLACLVLAFMRSWDLTLIILASIPVTILIQGLSQSFSHPLYTSERALTNTASTKIDRAISSITTIKAFNSSSLESTLISSLLAKATLSYRKCSAIWGLATGTTQFTLFAMFVQGFWYGSKLVRDGKKTPGDVTAVFWACVIASSALQACLPLFVSLSKGKSSLASLHSLLHPPSPSPSPSTHPSTPSTPLRPMTKLTPAKCYGSFDIPSLTFSYPSRPTDQILSISAKRPVHIASHEPTFILGASGSGKSTLGQLLLGMYNPTSGQILLDDQPIHLLSPSYLKQHILLLPQQAPLFPTTLLANLTLGLTPAPTQKQIEEACRIAMMTEFIKDLPEGLDTVLGGSGSAGCNLSGGQRQRLGVARAVLRDPQVLIIDEATSALDAPTRHLVFTALLHRRKLSQKTTIVITHDLAQLGPGDFAYVFKNGEIVQEGFWEDLIRDEEGEFRKGWELGGGGSLEDVSLEDHYEESDDEDDRSVLRRSTLDAFSTLAHNQFGGLSLRAPSPPSSNRNSAVGGQLAWQLDAIRDLVSPNRRNSASLPPSQMTVINGGGEYPPRSKTSMFWNRKHDLKEEAEEEMGYIAREEKNFNFSTSSLPSPTSPTSAGAKDGLHAKFDTSPRRSSGAHVSDLSLQFNSLNSRNHQRPTNHSSPSIITTTSEPSIYDKEEKEEEREFEMQKWAITNSGKEASRIRELRKAMSVEGMNGLPSPRVDWRRSGKGSLKEIKIDEEPTNEAPKEKAAPSIVKLIRIYFPTLPRSAKFSIFFGLLFAVLSGAMTPLFSFLLATLLAELGNPLKSLTYISHFALFVLLVAAIDGLASGAKFYLLEDAAMVWVCSLRNRSYEKVLKQDKAFFDKDENSPDKIVQLLMKDGDDARTLVATILGQFVVVVTMMSVGIIWALVVGWQLTLVGCAIGPLFAGAMMGQSILLGRFELRNKRAREGVAKQYYTTVSNIRAIRSMSLEPVFAQQFDSSLDEALQTGVRGAFITGLGYGVANALIYLSEALLFFTAAILISKGIYTYLQMIQVLNLVIFSVTIASQMLTFVPKIAKSKQAAADFQKLLNLSTDTAESKGRMRFPIEGNISFRNVSFAYPQRADAPALSKLSCDILDGECVAIVGESGSGKSTIAALLQRLYEPNSGTIRIGKHRLSDADAVWLRHHISIVSQHPALFDASVADNISYGAKGVPFEEIERAARDAHLHDFIMTLPKGYDTMLGENASLISGGQAQRLQIARALLNGRASVLIFDECTSALDGANQDAVMATVMKVKDGRTSIIITHKVPVMQMCDRILVMEKGAIVEDGSYDDLMARRGRFYTLANAGVWTGE